MRTRIKPFSEKAKNFSCGWRQRVHAAGKIIFRKSVIPAYIKETKKCSEHKICFVACIPGFKNVLVKIKNFYVRISLAIPQPYLMRRLTC